MTSIESRIGAELNVSGAFRPSWQRKVGVRPIRIREASWPADRTALETVRCAVFVTEQNLPRTLEFDGRDANALHWLALTPEEEPVGTLRLLPSGPIGRPEVLPTYRGRGVGSRLLRHAIAAAEAHGWSEVWVNAQYVRRGFYAAHGFIVISDLFEDAGIPHQRMLRPDSKNGGARSPDPCALRS